LRALVVDDHEFTREGVIRILTDNFPETKVGKAGNYDEALEQVKNNKWDIVVLDINLQGRSGLEVLKSIRSVEPKTPVLILSMVPVSQYVRRILQAGASGYLTKSEPAEELLKAVRMVSRGMKYFSPEVQQELPDLIDESIDHAKKSTLTDREFEILQRIAVGKSPKEIAAEYNLSVNTINSYRKRMLAKLHAKSDLDLIRYAIKLGIIE
jgi:two-component system invasion response regulator UvrY